MHLLRQILVPKDMLAKSQLGSCSFLFVDAADGLHGFVLILSELMEVIAGNKQGKEPLSPRSLLTEDPQPEVRLGGHGTIQAAQAGVGLSVGRLHPQCVRERDVLGECQGEVQSWAHPTRPTPGARDSQVPSP